MKKKLYFLSTLLVSLIIVLFLSSCDNSNSSIGTIPNGNWTPGQTSIKLLGASWYSESGNVHVFYSAEATNKSSQSFDGSSITVTCLDESGNKIYQTSSYIVPIASGDTICYSSSFKYSGTIPASLDLQFSDNIGMYSDTSVSYQSDFIVKDVHVSTSGSFYTISGTILNQSSKKQGVRVSAIFSHYGQIIGGDSSFADPIDSGKSGSFTIYLPHAFEEYDLYEVVANVY